MPLRPANTCFNVVLTWHSFWGSLPAPLQLPLLDYRSAHLGQLATVEEQLSSCHCGCRPRYRRRGMSRYLSKTTWRMFRSKRQRDTEQDPTVICIPKRIFKSTNRIFRIGQPVYRRSYEHNDCGSIRSASNEAIHRQSIVGSPRVT